MGNLLSMMSRNMLASFWTTDFADVIGDFVGSFLWLLSDIFFIILDMFEDLYRKFAGIDTNVTTSSGETIDGDLVLYFIQSNIVQQIFMSIFILSLFLLIIFTIFAIVKNQYSEKQEPVSKIVNSSFKALLMYLLVPIATIVCLLVGNVVLQAIDGATKTNDYAQTISDSLFSTATYNANRLRYGTTAEKAEQLENIVQEEGLLPQHIKDLIEQECNVDLDSTDTYISDGVDYDKMAIIIDEAFITGNLYGRASGANSDKWAFAHVSDFYYGTKISYITIWIGGAFLIWAIGKITWGLVARLFKMTLFYAISPAVMATFPIDGGKALGSWRGEMVKNGTMALCSVGILNVLYSVLPAFNNIDLYGDATTGGGLASSIARLFIYIIAFSSAKDLIGAISGWFGAGDALGEGVKAKGMVDSKIGAKKLASASKKGLGYFAGIQGGIDAASKHGGNKFMGALQGAFSQTGAAKTMSDYAKAYDDSKKAGKNQYKTHRTEGLFGNVNDVKLAEYEGYDIVAAENKKLQKQLDGAFDELIDKMAKLDDESLDDATYTKRLAEVQAEYKKEVQKIKSTASYLDPLFEDDKRKLESQQKDNEKRQSNFASFATLRTAIDQDEKNMGMYTNLMNSAGLTVYEEQWESIKNGDFSMYGDSADKAREIFNTVADRVASAQASMDSAKQSILNIATSSGDGLEYAQDVLGDTLKEMFDITKDDVTGKITGAIKKDTGSLIGSGISGKLEAEQQKINEALKEWEDANDKLIEDRAKKYGTKAKKDLEKIGRSADKK